MLNSHSQHSQPLARSGQLSASPAQLKGAQLKGAQLTGQSNPTQPPHRSLAESAESFQQLAVQMIGQGNFQLAVEYCNLALQAKPTGQSYKLLGDSLQRLGEPHRAEQAYRQAIQLEASAETYANLGSLYAQQQQWLKSLLCYQKAITLKPELTALQPNLDRLWFQIGQDAVAPTKLLEVFAANPQRVTASAHFNLGNILLERHQTPAAIACFQRSLQLNPQFAAAKQALEQLACSPEGVHSDHSQKTPHSQKPPHSQPPSRSPESLAVPPNPPDPPATATHSEPIDAEPVITVIKRARKAPQSAPAQPPEPVKPQADAPRSTPAVSNPASPAAALCRQADAAAQQQQWQTAIQYYQQAITLDPNFATAHWHLGQILERNGQWQTAIDRYYQALSLQPNLVTAAELRRFGDLFVQQKQLERALTCYEWSLRQEESAGTYRQIGDILCQQNQFAAAIAPYQKAIDLQPSADHYHQLAGVYLKLDQWQPAAEAYTQAIRLRPDYSWSHHNLGDVLQKLGQWEAAAAAYQRAIDLNPDFHWSHYNLGDVCGQQAQWDNAITAYQRAFQLQPTCLAAERKLHEALHYRAKADLERVQTYYQQAIEREPDNPDFFHQAIALDPRNPSLYIGLSKSLLRQGETEQAKVFYQMAVQLDPELKKKLLDLNNSFAW
ncbi:MAG: tetratricopeptide repeat protein [Elainella sp. Prado103]|nr:tetratricopeptide repeat protein [Elainella sp. Prado103]